MHLNSVPQYDASIMNLMGKSNSLLAADYTEQWEGTAGLKEDTGPMEGSGLVEGTDLVKGTGPEELEDTVLGKGTEQWEGISGLEEGTGRVEGTVLGKGTEQWGLEEGTGQVEGTVLGEDQSGKQEVGRDAAHLDLQESK